MQEEICYIHLLQLLHCDSVLNFGLYRNFLFSVSSPSDNYWLQLRLDL